MLKFKVQYNKEKIEVEASSSYDAQGKGLDFFQKWSRKKIKWWDLIVQPIRSMDNKDFKYL